MMLKRSLLLFLLVLTTGCGFKLRGMVDMPVWFNNVAIEMHNADHDTVTFLKEQLNAFKIRIIDNPTKADYLLIIEKDDIEQQITNVSAGTTPRQYQLTGLMVYSLIKVRGAPIFSSDQISVNRQFTLNNNRILGSDSEGQTIRKEMRREAVLQLINRLSRHRVD